MATVKNHVRPARAKTPAQLAKKARNEAAAKERYERLRQEQATAEVRKREEAARRAVVRERAGALLARAWAHPDFSTWARRNRLEETPGTAALFFARQRPEPEAPAEPAPAQEAVVGAPEAPTEPAPRDDRRFIPLAEARALAAPGMADLMTTLSTPVVGHPLG